MKTAKLALALRLGLATLAPAATALVMTTTLAGCADENDPKTWVKRLDDPARRVESVKRLELFFEDAMHKANDNREDPVVTKVLDDVVDPLAKTYVGGNLDEKTRKELIEALANMADPRASAAFTKALADFEPGKNDDDAKQAALGATRLANAGKLQDEALVDAIWSAFAKLHPSKVKSLQLIQAVRDAVLAAKHPSYGPKAVEKLSAPVDPNVRDQVLDNLEFWQLVSAQIVGELKFTPAVKPLVTALVTPAKASLSGAVRMALMRMPKEAEPVLVAALKGTDPDLAKLTAAYPDKGYVARLAEPIAYLSRDAGKAALLEALAAADNDTNRTIVAAHLTHFGADPKLQAAYLDAYKKIGNEALVPQAGGYGHVVLVGASANFYDPALVDWILKEYASAKGEVAISMPPAALPAAIKLMTADKAKAVEDAVNKIEGPALEKDMFKSAKTVLDKCGKDAACYVTYLDTPVPSTPEAAKYGHVKATWMAAIVGDDATRTALVGKVDKVKDPAVRLALVEAIDHLAPKGDEAAAAALEKIVEADKGSGNKGLLAANDSALKVALKLRSRAAH